MFIALNRFARSRRRRLVTLAAVLALCAVVVAAHGTIGEHHMGDGALACMAVLQVAALTAAGLSAVLGGRLAPLLRLRPAPLAAPLALLTFPPEARARPGPAVLQVFRL